MESNETNEEIKMLNINEIKFPIEFKVLDVGKIKFESEHNGFWADDKTKPSAFSLKYFVNKHNRENPKNEPDKNYYYIDASTVSDILRTADIMKMLQSDNFNPSGWKISSIGKPFTTEEIETISKIEDMPIGAKLLSIKNDDGSFDEVSFSVRRIEVNNDIITLLSGYAGGYSKNTNNYGIELNIKCGTIVRYKYQ